MAVQYNFLLNWAWWKKFFKFAIKFFFPSPNEKRIFNPPYSVSRCLASAVLSLNFSVYKQHSKNFGGLRWTKLYDTYTRFKSLENTSRILHPLLFQKPFKLFRRRKNWRVFSLFLLFFLFSWLFFLAVSRKIRGKIGLLFLGFRYYAIMRIFGKISNDVSWRSVKKGSLKARGFFSLFGTLVKENGRLLFRGNCDKGYRINLF